MTDLFKKRKPKKDDRRMYGPWTRCKHCHRTMSDWHKDENGVKWAIKLTKTENGWKCQYC